jgi:broad specificity phosphatase PhoE
MERSTENPATRAHDTASMPPTSWPRATSPGIEFDQPGRHAGFRSGAMLWLLRHGEVHADWHGRAYGGMDVPLSERGVSDTQQTIEAFGLIPIDAVYSSNLARALRLGEGIAQRCGAALTVTSELAEIQRGAWQGQRIAELAQTRPGELAGFYADPWNFSAHGGETDRDVLWRAWPPIERLIASGARTPLLTCHYNVVRVLLTRMLGLAPEVSFRLRIDLSGACLLHDSPAGWRLLRSNVKGPKPWPANC